MAAVPEERAVRRVFWGKPPLRRPGGMVAEDSMYARAYAEATGMGREIERKFLVVGGAWRDLAEGVLYRQGYLNSAKERTVRVRTAGNRAFLTVKGITTGAARMEYEYEIPFADGEELLRELAEKPLIEKKRYTIPLQGLVWEVDEFLGENLGLIVAEVELAEEGQTIDAPAWVGREVTGDPRYFNSHLVAYPFSAWGREPAGQF